jgi:DNA-nicking Smr family endonuclease
MNKSRGPMPSGRGILSEEDEELWASVAQNLEPVRRKERVLGALEPAKPSEAPQTELKRGRYGAAHQIHPPVKPRPVTPPTPVRSSSPSAAFDRRRARKLAAGRAEIEAQLDLHGMRQSEAHVALRAFLFACHAKGLRNVLVITGKGGVADDEPPSRPGDWSHRDRGILKRNMPRWLAEPELRAFVVGYTTAHPRHGGEGALYLQLRRRERVKDRG